jgi:protein ImuB
MPVAEALAIEPNLYVQEEHPERDVQALGWLAKWLERYSPIVGVEEDSAPQSLLLNISGCAACFHGEDTLLLRAATELADQGWLAHVASADTVGAAWALSHYAKTPCLAPPGEGERILRPLPVCSLRLPTEAIELLAKLGIKSIDQLLTLHRSSLPARFGPLVLKRLDEALGRRPEVIIPHRHLCDVQTKLTFDYPTTRLDVLNDALGRLAKRLLETLRGRNRGARQLQCLLYPEAEKPLRLELGLVRPSSCAHYIQTLLWPLLERTLITSPIHTLALRVSVAEPLVDEQAEFFENESEDNGKDLAALVDRLSSRLGAECISRAVLVSDAQPEHACRFEPMIQDAEPAEGRKAKKRISATTHRTMEHAFRLSCPPLPKRPLQLWPPVAVQALSVIPDGPPIQIYWSGINYRVLHCWGPERIETGWWRGEDIGRDYYVVATHRGNRLWVFRQERDGQWFLQGSFD